MNRLDLASTLDPTATTLNFHVLLEQTDQGRTIAAIAEISDCQVEADTREEALAALQAALSDRLAKIEIMPLTFSISQPTPQIARENPWTEFIGMFEGDAEFAELAAELRAERDLDDAA